VLYGGGGRDLARGGGGFDQVFGDYSDSYVPPGGNPRSDRLFGGRGPDQLEGEAGNDLLDGDAGSDSNNGGEGTDRCFSPGPSSPEALNCELPAPKP
jgi:Ca2+-binding RTX toxin-like protein